MRYFPSKIIFILISFFLISCILVNNKEEENKSPEINVYMGTNALNSGDLVDFGEAMINSSNLTIEFLIKNQGSETLKLINSPAVTITGIDSASFTIIQPEFNVITPGSEVTFSINFSPDPQLGLKQTSIHILTNQSNLSDYSLDLVGTVVPDISPITFNWYLHFNWFSNEWGTDPTSRYITEKTGVDINFIVPEGNEAETLDDLITSNDLPDFITLGWWEAQKDQMINNNLVYSLNELAENYDPYFFEVASPAKLGWYQESDGDTYCYPNASYTQNDYDNFNLPSQNSFLVRKDIYEAIGSPSMRTPEGFLDALRAAKELLPEIGDNPLIPFGLSEFTDYGNISLEQYLVNFLAIPRQEEGQLTDRSSHSEFKRWLEVFRSAYEEGLIDPEIFTDNNSTIVDKIEQGRYFSLFFNNADFKNQQMSLYQNDSNSYYIAVDGPSNINGDDPTLTGTGISGWTVTLISKNCSNPGRAIQFMSYWLSEEGQHDFSLGAPGQWETVNGRDQLTDEAEQLLLNDRVAYDIQYGGQQKFWMLMDTPMIKGMGWEPNVETPFKELYEWSIPYTDSYAQFDITIPADSAYSNIAYQIDMLSGTYLPLLITANTVDVFNNLWDQWQQEKNDVGIQALYGYMQSIYEENCEKLNIPIY